jgi:murein DD-endopeptidase MepM/ murein hydrolase activator NlpD
MFALALVLLAAAPVDPAAPQLSIQNEAAVPGGILVLDVHGVDNAKALHGHLLGQRLRFFTAGPHHQRALVGLSLDQKPGTLPVQVEYVHGLGAETLDASVEVQPKEFRKSELKVAPKFVSPPDSEKQHIAEDHLAIKAGYHALPFGPALFSGKLTPPRDSELTAHFGDQRIYNGKKRSAHMGTDFDGNIGDPIRAVAAGVVVLARACYYSGNTVFVDHGGGLFTSYFHMSRMDVKAGQKVKRGEQLGVVGKTGRVTGPHLHLGVKVFSRLVDAEEAFKVDLGLDEGTRAHFPDASALDQPPDSGAPAGLASEIDSLDGGALPTASH